MFNIINPIGYIGGDTYGSLLDENSIYKPGNNN